MTAIIMTEYGMGWSHPNQVAAGMGHCDFRGTSLKYMGHGRSAAVGGARQRALLGAERGGQTIDSVFFRVQILNANDARALAAGARGPGPARARSGSVPAAPAAVPCAGLRALPRHSRRHEHNQAEIYKILNDAANEWPSVYVLRAHGAGTQCGTLVFRCGRKEKDPARPRMPLPTGGRPYLSRTRHLCLAKPQNDPCESPRGPACGLAALRAPKRGKLGNRSAH